MLFWAGFAPAQTEIVPHAQDRPPGPALSPQEAIQRMKVPEGFRVELVASEPDLVNPVAMTFDELGRIWVTESLEYPRREPGPGRDRVKILEDTDGDGRADRFTVFADGLNIPSGIAVGHGGVWVANAPDILFLKDTDGDGKADTREVVVTGFGRADTHELPNSLTWGPDGWLYGWNGVFNPSRVRHRGKTFSFTCAVFRIHPRTREFEIYCEGTSNPWGIAFDAEGGLFASACVIDHLWHLVETGYYHRQGGPYPPYTWKIDSIVDHKHQKAAYCGIHYFDSDAYPERYREKLYMGNIHGNCINSDVLERHGSTYRAREQADFLTADDAWFMPVAEKTGPDGCLYVLDWYDRYHCYQDANRDPKGIDRLKGRLYRVRYRDTPRRFGFDLSHESDEALVQRLGSANIYDREIAQRLLVERKGGRVLRGLESLVLDAKASRKARMHALWVLVGLGELDRDFHLAVLDDTDPSVRAWGVRAAGNMHSVHRSILERVAMLASFDSPDVLLQVAIAVGKLEGIAFEPIVLSILSRCGDDALIPHIVWQNLHPRLGRDPSEFIHLATHPHRRWTPGLVELIPRVLDRLLDLEPLPADGFAKLLSRLVDGPDANIEVARRALADVASETMSGELPRQKVELLREHLAPMLAKVMSDPSGPLALDAALLAATWRDPAGLVLARKVFVSKQEQEPRRLEALGALIAARDAHALEAAESVLGDRSASTAEFRGRVLSALGRFDELGVAKVILVAYPRMEPELQPKAVELLTERPAWAKALLREIATKVIPADALNLNQLRDLQATKDSELLKMVRAQWGVIRQGRDPGREAVIARMREIVRRTPGDPIAGKGAFGKVCAQCHKFFGEGQEVGPDLTANGRGSFEQLLSNVFDPNLVIGPAYQATTVATTEGRVLTGLIAEESPVRLVLKVQGGKLESIPRSEIGEQRTATVSLMPEDLEKQLTPREWADLFAFLALDKPLGKPSPERNP
jgi:putative membrane-bound dehydrogenase-like protein